MRLPPVLTTARFPAALAAGVVAAFAIILIAVPSARGEDAAAPLRPGSSAPAWTLPSPEGAPVRFPDAASGRPAVVLFWATWCPYCKALMPHLDDIRDEYAESGVRIFAVNIWEDGDPVAFVREAGFDFVLALDGDEIAKSYGVIGTPGLFVVDGKGDVTMNRYLVELNERPNRPHDADQSPPARAASAWANVVRRALDAALAPRE